MDDGKLTFPTVVHELKTLFRELTVARADYVEPSINLARLVITVKGDLPDKTEGQGAEESTAISPSSPNDPQRRLSRASLAGRRQSRFSVHSEKPSISRVLETDDDQAMIESPTEQRFGPVGDGIALTPENETKDVTFLNGSVTGDGESASAPDMAQEGSSMKAYENKESSNGISITNSTQVPVPEAQKPPLPLRHASPVGVDTPAGISELYTQRDMREVLYSILTLLDRAFKSGRNGGNPISR